MGRNVVAAQAHLDGGNPVSGKDTMKIDWEQGGRVALRLSATMLWDIDPFGQIN